MKVHTDISLVCMLYECTIWSYLQVDYNYMLREAYIAINARNNASGTSGNFDKYNSFIQVHTQGKEWCGRPPPPTQHTHTHPSTHADETCYLRSYDTQNCSLVARPLFSFPSLSGHTAQNNRMQSDSRATPTLREGKGSIIKRLFWCCIAKSHK